MKSVVEGCQHVFVDGRQILNVALMANEIVDVFNTWNLEGTLCKLDMENAYDHVNWRFPDYMLERMLRIIGLNG